MTLVRYSLFLAVFVWLMSKPPDIARELYRNATEGQIEFLRASHEQQLAVLQVSDTTYRQVQVTR